MREHRHPASTWVLLADVRMSERRLRALSARKVELYRQWLEDGRHAPPVRLVRDGWRILKPLVDKPLHLV